MNFRAVLFGLIALLAAGGTVFGAKSWLDAQRAALAPKPVAPVAAKPATQILVAKQNLPQGTLLQPGHLHWQTWPDAGVIDAYAVRNKRKLEDFVGSVVRGGIAVGEPVTDTRVVFPGERGFLAAVLEVGMRAVTVPIDATSGIAGFVFPGDRVDLILTHSLDRDSGKQQRKASETVLSGVRVLAIDQRTNDQVNKPDLGRTATLEVTAKQTEMIPIITELGKLSLALRSLESPDQLVSGDVGEDPGQDPKRRKPGTRGETFTLDNEVSRLLDPPKKAGGGGGGQTVSVFQGGKAKTVTFNKSAQGWVPVVETAAVHSEGEKSEAPAATRGEGGDK